MDKIITFGIPCYNSADYMDKCVESILKGANYAEDIEIVIVDDGSFKDDTPAKADEWAAKHPGIIKAVHQENGGHGTAVLTGLSNASGTFYKDRGRACQRGPVHNQLRVRAHGGQHPQRR